MKTGVSGATALSSSIVGRRFSANWCSVKPPTTRTHCGGGVTATCRFSMFIASASERTPSQRSSMLKFRPPRMMWRWLSIRPGSALRPLRSMVLVSGPAWAITSASLPTARKRPSLIATALAVGLPRSSVVKRPLRRMRSAVIGRAPGPVDCGPGVWALALPSRPVRAPAAAPKVVWRRVGLIRPVPCPCRRWAGVPGARRRHARRIRAAASRG